MGKCGACPSKESPRDLGIPCKPCREAGVADPNCPNCHGWGNHTQVACPFVGIEDVAWEVIDAADMLKNNSGWPTLAGWYDQPHSLRKAVLFVHRWKGVGRPKAEGEE